MCWRHYTWYVECRLRECDPKIQDNCLCGPAEVEGLTEETMENCPIRYMEGHSEYRGKCPACKAQELPQARKRKLEEYKGSDRHTENYFSSKLERALASVKSEREEGKKA
jgi:hypothetical protein